jgi:ubiquinone/menaquinone biosynthesis C-methylase UbiE
LPVNVKKSNEAYYDEFSDWYEKHRHEGYHALIDALETDLVLPMARAKRVLEVGCGTGLILQHADRVADQAVGLDISEGMLRHAQSRGLTTVRASATDIPFADHTFDLVYSFKVLSHIPDLERALAEMARVTRPGGDLLLEFYNRGSLRYIASRLRSGRISAKTTESAVYTRYDSLRSLKRLLPPELTLAEIRGVRVFTPHAIVHRIPGLRQVMSSLEWWARDSFLARFGGFLVLHLKRVQAAPRP